MTAPTCPTLDNYIELFAEGDEKEQDKYKVLALNLGGVTTSAFFEERFFSSAGKVWNNGTFSLKPQKFEIKTIVGKEATFIERVLSWRTRRWRLRRCGWSRETARRRRQRRCGVVGKRRCVGRSFSQQASFVVMFLTLNFRLK